MRYFINNPERFHDEKRVTFSAVCLFLYSQVNSLAWSVDFHGDSSRQNITFAYIAIQHEHAVTVHRAESGQAGFKALKTIHIISIDEGMFSLYKGVFHCQPKYSIQVFCLHFSNLERFLTYTVIILLWSVLCTVYIDFLSNCK